MFTGDAIPGLGEVAVRVLNEMVGPPQRPVHPIMLPGEGVGAWEHPIEFDDYVAAVEREGFGGPMVRNHLEWMCVEDPRVVRNGRPITEGPNRVELLVRDAGLGR